MASLLIVVLFAILFNVYYISGMGEEVIPTSPNGVLDSLVKLEDPKAIHDLKNKMSTVIQNLSPEEYNQTEPAVNGTDESTETRHNHSTTPTESPDYEDDHTTESRFDSKGCDRHLRDKHEDDCFDNFQHVLKEHMEIEDENERGKEICCSSEGYERCCVLGYQRANCKADHQAIKEGLKAARMFMATLSNTSCSMHRGKCDFGSAAGQPSQSSFLLMFLGLLPIALLL